MEEGIDGGSNMCGIKKGLVGQLKQSCAQNKISEPMLLHCIIHQQALCAKYVDISCALNPVIKVVSFLRSHGLNHRQFREMLKETDTESVDLPYYTAIRWLSCGKVQRTVFELRKKICEFPKSKGKPQPLLPDEELVWKLAFVTDITDHMNNLYLKLPGKKNHICDLYTHLKAFRYKLDLFLKHVKVKKIFQFEKCKVFNAEATTQFPIAFSCEIIQDLQH